MEKSEITSLLKGQALPFIEQEINGYFQKDVLRGGTLNPVAAAEVIKDQTGLPTDQLLNKINNFATLVVKYTSDDGKAVESQEKTYARINDDEESIEFFMPESFKKTIELAVYYFDSRLDNIEASINDVCKEFLKDRVKIIYAIQHELEEAAKDGKTLNQETLEQYRKEISAELHAFESDIKERIKCINEMRTWPFRHKIEYYLQKERECRYVLANYILGTSLISNISQCLGETRRANAELQEAFDFLNSISDEELKKMNQWCNDKDFPIEEKEFWIKGFYDQKNRLESQLAIDTGKLLELGDEENGERV